MPLFILAASLCGDEEAIITYFNHLRPLPFRQLNTVEEEEEEVEPRVKRKRRKQMRRGVEPEER